MMNANYLKETPEEEVIKYIEFLESELEKIRVHVVSFEVVVVDSVADATIDLLNELTK